MRIVFWVVINSQKPQSTCVGGARAEECVTNTTRSACARGNMAQWVARADNGIIVVACLLSGFSVSLCVLCLSQLPKYGGTEG